MPKVSVIIPTYNRANFIGETIQSVLDQTFQDFEIIVVDDGSTDNTKEIIESFIKKSGKIKYLYEKNSGTCAAPRNVGFYNSTGKYLCFLDSDDLWLPEKLQKQIDFFKNSGNEKLGFIDCGTLIINEHGKEIKNNYNFPKYQGNVYKDFLKYNFVLSPGSVLIKRSVLENIGLFDENLPSAEDWELWIRISKKYEFASLKEPLFKYRVHINNLTSAVAKRGAESLGIYVFQKYKEEFRINCPDYYYQKIREIAGFYCKSNNISLGKKLFKEAMVLNKKDLRNYVHYFLSLFGSKFYSFSIKLLKLPRCLFTKNKEIQPNDLRGKIYKDVLNIKA